ncbi:hypothetical protein ACHAWF_001804 [Thalassiosira exigua]
MIMSNANADTSPFNVGDRVTLQGLVKAKRLNGRHGVVGLSLDSSTGRYAVDLDLPDALDRGASTTGIAVKGANLLREPPLPAEADERRAGVNDGRLVEEQGRPLSFILDNVRFLVGYLFIEDPNIQTIKDIDRLKDISMIQINFLTATGWSHWVDCGAYSNSGGKGIYLALKDWMQKQSIENTPYEQLDEGYKLIYDAIDAPSAVAGWNCRVHGDFWVDSDAENDGTHCILASNPRAVYQVVGMTQSLGRLIARTSREGSFERYFITMIPWYGRLVFDGLICPAGSDGNPARFPQTPSAGKAAKLRESIRLAKEEGRVISRLAQLEVPGGSMDGAGPIDYSPLKAAGEMEEEEEEQQDEPSEKEKEYLDCLKALQPMPAAVAGPDGQRARWTFRRQGYSEEENPDYSVLVLAHDTRLGGFQCQALKPTSEEILGVLTTFSEKAKYRPKLINIDEKKCCKRMEFLLRDVIAVMYYLPPSREEQAAQYLCNASGEMPTFG